MRLSYHGESSCLGNMEYVSQMGRGQHLHPRKLTCNPKKLAVWVDVSPFPRYFQVPKFSFLGVVSPHISTQASLTPGRTPWSLPPPLTTSDRATSVANPPTVCDRSWCAPGRLCRFARWGDVRFQKSRRRKKKRRQGRFSWGKCPCLVFGEPVLPSQAPSCPRIFVWTFLRLNFTPPRWYTKQLFQGWLTFTLHAFLTLTGESHVLDNMTTNGQQAGPKISGADLPPTKWRPRTYSCKWTYNSTYRGEINLVKPIYFRLFIGAP